MPDVTFKRGTQAEIDAIAIQDGQVLWTTDQSGTNNRIYTDVDPSTRIQIGGTVVVDSALSTTSTNPVQNAVITNKVGTASLTTDADDLSGAINEHDTEIGNLSSLTTTNKTSLVSAVNEHDTEIGTLSSLTTTNKTNLVSAVNEIDSDTNITSYTLNSTYNCYAYYTPKFLNIRLDKTPELLTTDDIKTIGTIPNFSFPYPFVKYAYSQGGTVLILQVSTEGLVRLRKVFGNDLLQGSFIYVNEMLIRP